MKAKFALSLLILTLFIGICFSASAAENEYIVVIKDDYANDSEVLKHLEPLWADAGIYYLKDSSDIEYMRPYCESIEKDQVIDVVFEDPDPVLMTEPSDQYFYKQWNHDMINVEASRDIENYGEGVKVGVIDSGIKSHPDFENRILKGKNYFDNTSDVTDNHGHGTHVSGIIAAGMNNIGVCGVAPKAYIVPLKAFDTGKTTTTTMLANAIKDAVNVFDCDVINMSFGLNTNVNALKTAINYAAENDVILVASAGNAENGETPDKISYPAYYDAVISVASVTSSGTRATYSYYNRGVTVAAPGNGIYSTSKSGGYTSMTGTSQAAPHVAGVAALALSINPNLSKAEFEEILTSTCTDKGDPGRDDYYGYGMVNVDAVIEEIMKDIPLYVSPIHQSGTTTKFYVRNNTDTPYEATYIYAQYAENELTNLSTTYMNLKKGEGKTVSYDFDYTKHFLWKSLESMYPLK